MIVSGYFSILFVCSSLLVGFSYAQEEPLCTINNLIKAIKNETFTYAVLVEQDQVQKYQESNFDVTYTEYPIKTHPFYQWVGFSDNIEWAQKMMECTVADIHLVNKTCYLTSNPSELQDYFDNAFKNQVVKHCKVPKGYFVLSIRWGIDLPTINFFRGGKWSVFRGLYPYSNVDQAKIIIQAEIRRIVSKLKTTRLQTLDINNNLNIIPNFTKGSLTSYFNYNRQSEYIKNKIPGEYEAISQTSILKVFPPGSELIIGGIYNGTRQVQQICENNRLKEVDCGVKCQEINIKAYQKEKKENKGGEKEDIL